MKTLTLQISDDIDRSLENLKGEFNKTSRAEIVRLGIAMLKVIAQERKNGFRAVLVKEGAPEKEFVF